MVEFKPVTRLGLQRRGDTVWHRSCVGAWEDGVLIAYQSYCGGSFLLDGTVEAQVWVPRFTDCGLCTFNANRAVAAGDSA